MAVKIHVGDRVKVLKVTKLEEHNPDLKPYIGQTGEVVLRLPSEWGLPPMYRVDFDSGLASLAFFARELHILKKGRI